MRLLPAALCLLASTAALGAATPSQAAEPPAVVSVLSGARVGEHAVVTTRGGTTVAVWERATAQRTTIMASVRPPAGEWRAPRRLASWAAEDVGGSRGDPQLAGGPSGSAVAVWVDERHRVVRSTWREGRGWGALRRLSGERERAQDPRAVSNDHGQVVVAWHRRIAAGRLAVRVGVQRAAQWLVRTVGSAGPRGPGVGPVLVGIDAAGNVTAAWYRLRPKPPHSGDGSEPAQDLSLASRLAVGSTTWEAPRAFAGWEPYFGDERTSLVVQDDGTAWVGDWAGAYNAPQTGPMWTRQGDGPWVADDRAPFANNFATSAGNLISWGDSSAFARDAVHTRQPDGSWTSVDLRATSVVVDDAGDAAAVGIRAGTLLVWIRGADGTWGPEQVLVENPTRMNDRSTELVASTSIAPDGTVTVLWRTYANEYPGDHSERGPDLRSVQFSAVAPAP